jgi:CheY-like chemotaxis protein
MDDLSNNRKMILVVEDDENNMLFYQELFKRSAYNAVFARNGLDAVKMVENEKDIALILMDIKMPVMGGFDAFREIMKIRKIPVIAHTAYALSGDREKAIALGFNDYVTKPISRDILFRKIDALINSVNETQ